MRPMAYGLLLAFAFLGTVFTSPSSAEIYRPCSVQGQVRELPPPRFLLGSKGRTFFRGVPVLMTHNRWRSPWCFSTRAKLLFRPAGASPHQPDAFSSSHSLTDDGELGCER